MVTFISRVINNKGSESMRKLTKFIYILFLFLLILPIFNTIIDYQSVGKFSSIHLLQLQDYPLIGAYMSEFLFWLSIGMSIFIIIGIVIVVFFPSAKSKLQVEREQGTLVIQKKAIENFALYLVQEEPYISEPKVMVTFHKRRIKMTINGNMRKAFQLSDKQEKLSQRISSSLEQLIGEKEKIHVKIIFRDLSKSTSTKNHSRVE